MMQGDAPKPTRLKALACNTNAREVDVGELAVDRVLLGEHQRDTQIAAIGGWLVIGDVLEVLNDLEPRSEEHTSELQSLMRISYAVFCLKKKKNKIHTRNNKI